MDNSVNSRCFACGRLHEDTHHVLRCTSEVSQEARAKARSNFNAMLSNYHIPQPMAELIIDSIEQWSAEQQVPRPMYHPQDFDDTLDQELHSHILSAFNKQTKIGWAHFLCGWISRTWKLVIAHYYGSQEPGAIFSPDLWMRKAIEQTWHYYIMIWHCRNGKLHSHNFEESQQKAIAMKQHEAHEFLQDQQDTSPTVKHASSTG